MMIEIAIKPERILKYRDIVQGDLFILANAPPHTLYFKVACSNEYKAINLT